MSLCTKCSRTMWRTWLLLAMQTYSVWGHYCLFVFQLKPQSIFLEEEVSKNVEFPEEGRFQLVGAGPGKKYIVCGDPESAPSAAESTPASQPGPSNPSSSAAPGWSIPRPWAPLNNLKVNPPKEESSCIQ